MGSKAIIDGSYNIYRSVFKGMNLYTSAGVPSGGSFLFLKILWNIKELGSPIVVLDGGHSPFRTEIFPNYKNKEEKSEEKDPQLTQAFNATFAILTKLLPKMGVPVVKMDGEEADDVAYVLAKHFRSQGDKVYVVSDDADWEQNVNLGAVCYKAMKDEYVTQENFLEKRGFDPKFFAMYKAIIGDSSDGIPGVHGIGQVGATKIMKELSEPTLLALNMWGQSGTTKLHEKIRDQFSVVKRNMLLIDFNNIQIQTDAALAAYNSANDLAKVDFTYVNSKFTSLEFNSLQNWLVYLSQK